MTNLEIIIFLIIIALVVWGWNYIIRDLFYNPNNVDRGVNEFKDDFCRYADDELLKICKLGLEKRLENCDNFGERVDILKKLRIINDEIESRK